MAPVTERVCGGAHLPALQTLPDPHETKSGSAPASAHTGVPPPQWVAPEWQAAGMHAAPSMHAAPANPALRRDTCAPATPPANSVSSASYCAAPAFDQ